MRLATKQILPERSRYRVNRWVELVIACVSSYAHANSVHRVCLRFYVGFLIAYQQRRIRFMRWFLARIQPRNFPTKKC